MTNILERNKKTLIRSAFLIPIISVAAISISHVVSWYDLANPASWAIYLSIAVEIAAMSAIAAASVKIRGFSVWFVFSIVTLIQFIGNIYFSYTEIDINSQSFKDWIDLTSPITTALGNDLTDVVAQRRFLAILEGGLLPLISLTCLHFFIGYEETSELTPGDSVIEDETEIAPIHDEPKESSPVVIDEEESNDLEEEGTASNIEQSSQIDNNEEAVEQFSQDLAENSVDYTQSTETFAKDIGVKVQQLSQKMKKILNR